MRLWMIAPVGLALVTAACGATEEQRAASGGIGGAAAGAVVGGPVGAVVGGAAGAAGGMLRDDAEQAIDERSGETQVSQADRRGGELTNREVRQAQLVLQDMGLYDGQIDGIYGPRTQSAVEQYQQRQNLPQTAALDQRTMNALRQQAQAGGDMNQQPRQDMDMQQRQQQQQQREQQGMTPEQREQQGMAPGQGQELRQDMEEQRQEMRQDMQEQRQEMRQEMEEQRQDMRQEMDEPQTMPRQ